MSPRAAWRLETLGFGEVYDYIDGKVDWMAAGLPTEGTNAQHPRAGDIARKDVPTAGLQEKLGDVKARVARSTPRGRAWAGPARAAGRAASVPPARSRTSAARWSSGD